MSDLVERKRVALQALKTVDAPAGDGATPEMRFSGYGAFFGNVDSYGDVIEPGAFKKSLKASAKDGSWPAMLLQHGGWGIGSEDYMPVGVWDTLTEDSAGLVTEGVLADIERGRDAYTLMKMQPRPAITGLSIGYIPRKFTLGTKPDEPRRTLHEVELIEISIVTFPANGKARISAVKSGDGDFSEREFEALLRDAAGLSKKEAQTVIAHGFRALVKGQRDSGCGELDALAQAIKTRTALFAAT